MYSFKPLSFGMILLFGATSLLSMNPENIHPMTPEEQQAIEEFFPGVYRWTPEHQRLAPQVQDNEASREAERRARQARLNIELLNQANHEAFQAWFTATRTPLPGMAQNQDQAAQSQENPADATPQNQQPE